MVIEEERKSRKRMLHETSKEGRKGFWRLMFVITLISVLFYTYFIAGYLLHKYELD